MVTFLTKSTGLLGPVASILGLIMNAIYEFFHLFGIQNIALSIIVFTFIVRTLMLPLTIKQQKFSKLSSRMNPEIQKIQAKYKGKKDEASLRKQQDETQIVYQKYGANPTSGCLPILITLPVMFALYSVINNIPAYVGQVKNMYEAVALSVSQVTGYQDILKTLSDGLRITSTDFSTTDQIINALAKFQTSHWNSLMSSMPGIKDVIVSSYDQLQKVNNFFGMNIANAPGWKFPGILIPILAMLLQFVQGKQLEVKSNNQDPTANAMKSMNIVMPIMSGFFCVTFPTGVGIYWIATSVYAIIQQFFVNKYMNSVDIDKLIEKNVAKASKRKPLMAKKIESKSVSLEELAKKQTKSIGSSAMYKNENSENSGVSEKSEDVSFEGNTASTGNPKSISEIANLLKSRNSDKGDK